MSFVPTLQIYVIYIFGRFKETQNEKVRRGGSNTTSFVHISYKHEDNVGLMLPWCQECVYTTFYNHTIISFWRIELLSPDIMIIDRFLKCISSCFQVTSVFDHWSNRSDKKVCLTHKITKNSVKEKILS